MSRVHIGQFFVRLFRGEIIFTTNYLSPNLFLRYRNDIYAVFDSNSACTQLWIFSIHHTKTLNLPKKNPNRENLRFLEVQIKLNDAGYDTCVR